MAIDVQLQAIEPERTDTRDPAKWARAFELLDELGRLYPSFRLAQLVCGLAATAESAVEDSVYDLEDDELIAAAEGMIAFYHANR